MVEQVPITIAKMVPIHSLWFQEVQKNAIKENRNNPGPSHCSVEDISSRQMYKFPCFQKLPSAALHKNVSNLFLSYKHGLTSFLRFLSISNIFKLCFDNDVSSLGEDSSTEKKKRESIKTIERESPKNRKQLSIKISI